MNKILLSFFLLVVFGCSEKEQITLPVADFVWEVEPNGKVSFKNNSTNADSFTWEFNDGKSPSNESNPVHIFSENGTYEIVLNAKNKNGVSKKSYIIKIDNVVIPQMDAPVFSIADGSYCGVQKIEIKNSNNDSKIYYTLDGTAPTINSILYTAPIELKTEKIYTILAIAVKDKFRNSDVSKASYNIAIQDKSVEKVTSSLASGDYLNCQTIALNSSTPNAKIYYTLNGSEPTTSSNVYSNPFKISNGITTIKSIAVKDCYLNSNTTTNAYSIKNVNDEEGGIHYANWNFGLGLFKYLSFDFTIYDYPRNDDGSLNNDGIYLQMYNSFINGTQFYFGIQTHTNNPETRVSKKGIILSRWNTRDLNNIRLGNNAFTESAGYEDDFISVRKHYEWKPQSYRFVLEFKESDNIGDWYQLTIVDLKTNVSDVLGSMRFPKPNSGTGGISNGSGSWSEVYGKGKKPSPLATWKVSFDKVLAGDNRVSPISANGGYLNKTSQNVNVYSDANRKVYFEMGNKVCKGENTVKFW